MTKNALATLFLSIALAACNGGKDSTDDTDVNETDTTETDTTETDTTTEDTDVSEDTDVEASAACQAWCIPVTDACTGDNAQFPSENACLAFCAASGIADGASTDDDSNTLGCRQHYADLADAGDEAAKTANCPLAGAFGGGTCGTLTSNFCAVDLHVCTGGNAAYADLSACTTAAEGFSMGEAGATSGDSLSCRLYHLGVATGSPVAHCPHTALDGGGVCSAPQ